MTWELVGYNTDCRYRDDIRYRRYTRSEPEAALFKRIPKLGFTDSGHGIVFTTTRLKHGERRLPEIATVANYVHEHLARIRQEDKVARLAARRVPETVKLRLTLDEAILLDDVVRCSSEKNVWADHLPEKVQAAAQLAAERQAAIAIQEQTAKRLEGAVR